MEISPRSSDVNDSAYFNSEAVKELRADQISSKQDDIETAVMNNEDYHGIDRADFSLDTDEELALKDELLFHVYQCPNQAIPSHLQDRVDAMIQARSAQLAKQFA